MSHELLGLVVCSSWLKKYDEMIAPNIWIDDWRRTATMWCLPNAINHKSSQFLWAVLSAIPKS